MNNITIIPSFSVFFSTKLRFLVIYIEYTREDRSAFLPKTEMLLNWSIFVHRRISDILVA